MIERLSIENLVLVEKTAIEFGPGLNILTGETGAGKSAVLSAIQLLLGERADTQLIRQGADMAIVEGTFQLGAAALEKIGLSPRGGRVHVRRELHRSGRSRAFVEEALVSLQELRVLFSSSIEWVDQGSALQLLEPGEQRRFLDAFAETEGSLAAFREKFDGVGRARAEQEERLRARAAWQVERQKIEADLAWVEQVGWRAGEEETLEAEQKRLAHSQELAETIGEITAFLSDGSPPALPVLKRFAHLLEQSSKLDPALQESAALCKSASIELEEANRFLTSYLNRLEADPGRLAFIEKRLGEIGEVKRAFRVNGAGLQELQQGWHRRLAEMAEIDSHIEEGEKRVLLLEEGTIRVASAISAKRWAAAEPFADAVMRELKSVNLEAARFALAIESTPLSAHGLDEVRALFAANPGGPLLSLDRSASGGELSRLLFAIRSVLADKDGCSCLILDEIDSNVGGQTAAILGQKLQRLAASRQLICVTHFVQVAECAEYHFLVAKETGVSSAKTVVSKLSPPSREQEYARMTGRVE